MAGNRRKWIAGAISTLIGVACALVLGVLFYVAMAYQLAGGDRAEGAQAQGLLAIADATLASEQTVSARYGGQDCTAVVRTYSLADGTQAEAVTAQPAAYIERMSEEGYVPQLITGFSLAGMDAVYAVRGQEGMLCARQGETIYMLRAQADEQAIYALGAAAGIGE